MLPSMTTRYHDSGILALGFSAGVLIDVAARAFAIPGAPDHHANLARLACGALVGPLIVLCLLLKATVPHRVVLVMGLMALVVYVVLGVR
ncbi:MAG TPA: hypothetical protein VGJ12_13050 [Gemmatimonadaceae bacterium]|jgi:hypothetical protein